MSPVSRRRPHPVLAEVRGSPILPLEPPAAYADVPRLQLGADGTVGPWERLPLSEPGLRGG